MQVRTHRVCHRLRAPVPIRQPPAGLSPVGRIFSGISSFNREKQAQCNNTQDSRGDYDAIVHSMPLAWASLAISSGQSLSTSGTHFI
jgi:hypothetical protein